MLGWRKKAAAEEEPAAPDGGGADDGRPPAAAQKPFMQALWPVLACGSGLFSDGYINNVSSRRRLFFFVPPLAYYRDLLRRTRPDLT